MSAERSDLNIDISGEETPEKRSLKFEKKYPQNEEELRLELEGIWEKIKQSIIYGKMKTKSMNVLEFLNNIKDIIEETVEAFKQGKKGIVRNNFNFLRKLEKRIGITSDNKEKREIPEMELDADQRKKEFFKALDILKEKTNKEIVRSLLEQLGDDFIKAVKKGDLKEEEDCWLALYSFKEDLDKIERAEENLTKLLTNAKNL